MGNSQLLVLFFLTVQSSIFSCKEYNQSDFGNHHLVMSMCIVRCLVLLEKGVCYDQCILLAQLCQPLPCFILYSKTKLACYSWYILASYFSLPAPSGMFFCCCLFVCFFFLVLVLEGLIGLQRTIQLQLLVSAQTWVTVILNDVPWKPTEIVLSFLRLHPSTELY